MNIDTSRHYRTSAAEPAARPGSTQIDGGNNADRQADAEEQRQLAELRARDREVRTHEQAHQAAGGRYVAGGMRLDYQRGPDGRYYAVGGEVSISTSAVAGDPEATLRKMDVVRRAALAPAEPSAQDMQVAAQAAAAANQARLELARERGGDYGTGDGTTPASRAYGAAAAEQRDGGSLLDLLA